MLTAVTLGLKALFSVCDRTVLNNQSQTAVKAETANYNSCFEQPTTTQKKLKQPIIITVLNNHSQSKKTETAKRFQTFIKKH